MQNIKDSNIGIDQSWLTPNDVVKLNLLPIELKAVREFMKSGEIESFVINGRFYTTRSKVNSYLESKAV
jgi:hypothetical protein